MPITVYGRQNLEKFQKFTKYSKMALLTLENLDPTLFFEKTFKNKPRSKFEVSNQRLLFFLSSLLVFWFLISNFLSLFFGRVLVFGFRFLAIYWHVCVLVCVWVSLSMCV